MTTLVLGASGATGRLLVEQLLSRGEEVRVIVRFPAKFAELIPNHENLSVIQASVLDLSDAELAIHAGGCGAVASCLGHNLSWKGIFGQPHKLVTEAVRRLCQTIRANKPSEPVKFVLMNTTGNRNRDLSEKISFGQKSVIRLLRLLVPPHADNEEAADYLRTEVGQDDGEVQWVAVRPDTLVDEPEVTGFEIHPSPIRSAIFDPGKTSRINVARFMADLISDDNIWDKWKGQMPVIYNQEVEG